MSWGHGRRVIGLLIAFGAVAMLLSGGCKSKKLEGEEELQELAKVAKKAREAKGIKTEKVKRAAGISEDWMLDHPNCIGAHWVREYKAGTPEGVIWKLYEAALGDDSDEGFKKFFGLLEAERNSNEKFIRDQHWPRFRKRVKTYVKDENDPSFIVCREVKRGDDETKVFVFSNDPNKGPTPYPMKKVNGEWRISMFTP